jgi:hypothetical protein
VYGVHTNEEIEKFVNLYISCDVSFLPNPLQNAQYQHTHTCKKKNHVVYRFHYSFPPMREKNKIVPFSQQYL